MGKKLNRDTFDFSYVKCGEKKTFDFYWHGYPNYILFNRGVSVYYFFNVLGQALIGKQKNHKDITKTYEIVQESINKRSIVLN